MQLSAVLEYRNNDLIDAFVESTGISYEDSCDIFEETKKFLFLCAKRGDSQRIFINDPMVIIDEMWHEFITRTVDYAEFCNKYLGKFIHHVPVSKTEREKANLDFIENPEKYRSSRIDMFSEFYETILIELGRSTLYKWQVMYREKYSPEMRKTLLKGGAHIKNVTVNFPSSERNFQQFESILYGVERDDRTLIDELVSVEMRSTSRWPNHRCGAYCSCRTKCST